ARGPPREHRPVARDQAGGAPRGPEDGGRGDPPVEPPRGEGHGLEQARAQPAGRIPRPGPRPRDRDRPRRRASAGVSGEDVRAALAACPLFQDIARDPAALEGLAAICAVKRGRAGGGVIAAARAGGELYVIRAGRVRTEKRTPSRDPYTVRFQERGDVFGEMSLLDPDIRSATVVAETDCEFVVMDRERFLAFGDRHPAAGLVLTRRL